MLKTPTSNLGSNGGGQHPDKRKAGGHGPAVELLPTPSASNYGSNQGGAAGRVGPVRYGLNSIDKLLPTPTVNDSRGGRNATANRSGGSKPFNIAFTLVDVAYADVFGRYEMAVSRWAEMTRRAPEPTENGRLSADFVEWMMGFPEGFTAIVGAKKTHRLKALGNAVVSMQAEAAFIGLGGRKRGKRIAKAF